MSADLCRRGAARARELADGATPGPWMLWDGWGPTSDGLMGFERLGPPGDQRVFVHDEQRDLYATKADAEHVVTWDPTVTRFVADWLELHAEWVAEHEECGTSCAVYDAESDLGVATARALLREAP